VQTAYLIASRRDPLTGWLTGSYQRAAPFSGAFAALPPPPGLRRVQQFLVTSPARVLRVLRRRSVPLVFSAIFLMFEGSA
jgi:hypothetical protein